MGWTVAGVVRDGEHRHRWMASLAVGDDAGCGRGVRGMVVVVTVQDDDEGVLIIADVVGDAHNTGHKGGVGDVRMLGLGSLTTGLGWVTTGLGLAGRA